MAHQKHEHVLPLKNGVHWTKNIQFEKKYPKIKKTLFSPLKLSSITFILK